MDNYSEYIKRIKRLAGIKEKTPKQYLIKITFLKNLVAESLNEHNVYKNFQNSSNRYVFHPESTNPPVKAHYHVYPSNSKNELYAANLIDGKAHHKKNRGLSIPQKEADELRSLGVNLPKNNILETIFIDEFQELQLLNEDSNGDDSFYLMVEE